MLCVFFSCLSMPARRDTGGMAKSLIPAFAVKGVHGDIILIGIRLRIQVVTPLLQTQRC